MISIVVSIVLVLLLAGGVAVGVLRARKKSLSISVSRLGLTLVALGLSILLTWLLAGAFTGGILSAARSALPALDEILAGVRSTFAWFRAFAATAIATVLLMILFPIVNALLRIAVKPLARLLDKKLFHGEKSGDGQGENSENSGNSGENSAEGVKKSPVRLVLGGLCGLVFAVAMLSPTVGTLKLVGDMASVPAALTEEADGADAIESFAGVGDAIPVQAIWYIGGAPIYKSISTYGGVSVTRESALFADLGDYLRDPSEEKGPFSSYSSAMEKSSLVSDVLPDVLGLLFGQWADGEPYAGLNAPGTVGITGQILSGGLDEFSKMNREQMKQSVPALVDLTVHLLDNGGTWGMDSLLTDEDSLTDIYTYLVSVEPLHEALKLALEAGMDAMMSKWSGSGVVIAGAMPTDAADEARALAHATVALVNFSESFSLEGDSLEDTLYNLGQVLDGFKDSDMVGREQTKELMESALRSETIKNALGYDTAKAEEAIDDILDEIDLDGQSYADLLSALAEKVGNKG